MNLVKKFVLAVIFVSALSVPTFAGDMETPGKTAPPPPTGGSATTTTDASLELLYDAYTAMLGLY